MSDIDTLKGLTPEERLARIRILKSKLEDQKKKLREEEEEAERLERQSHAQIEQEIRRLRDIPIEQVKADSLEQLTLTSEDGKQIVKQKRMFVGTPDKKRVDGTEDLQEGELELGLRDVEAFSPIPKEMLEQEYIRRMAQAPMYELYTRANEIREDVYNAEQISYEQATSLYTLAEAVEQKKRDISEGVYSTSDEIMHQIDTATRIIDQIMGRYRT